MRGDFHLRDGFVFRRDEDNITIKLVLYGETGEVVHSRVTVPVNEWASVLAQTCIRGETGETFAEALSFLALTNAAE